MRFGHTCWCTVVSVIQPLGLRFTSSNESLTDVVFSSVLRELSLNYERFDVPLWSPR